MEVLATCALAVAGVAAGALGAAGGITSLVSYPALLLVGVPPLPASVANLVAGVACWPGSALTSRTELAAVQGHLTRALVIAAAGGACGAALLIMTSAETFARVVPFMVAAGSLLLMVQPRLTAYLRQRPSPPQRPPGRVDIAQPGVGLRRLLRRRRGHSPARHAAHHDRRPTSGSERPQEHDAGSWCHRFRDRLRPSGSGELGGDITPGRRAVGGKCLRPDHRQASAGDADPMGCGCLGNDLRRSALATRVATRLGLLRGGLRRLLVGHPVLSLGVSSADDLDLVGCLAQLG